eukprot:m.25961 g.25961  ORF g.25961 m.25961 type:complete len:736 (-) comp15225_c0_seq1:401-2608(-)
MHDLEAISRKSSPIVPVLLDISPKDWNAALQSNTSGLFSNIIPRRCVFIDTHDVEQWNVNAIMQSLLPRLFEEEFIHRSLSRCLSTRLSFSSPEKPHPSTLGVLALGGPPLPNRNPGMTTETESTPTPISNYAILSGPYDMATNPRGDVETLYDVASPVDKEARSRYDVASPRKETRCEVGGNGGVCSTCDECDCQTAALGKGVCEVHKHVGSPTTHSPIHSPIALPSEYCDLKRRDSFDAIALALSLHESSPLPPIPSPQKSQSRTPPAQTFILPSVSTDERIQKSNEGAQSSISPRVTSHTPTLIHDPENCDYVSLVPSPESEMVSNQRRPTREPETIAGNVTQLHSNPTRTPGLSANELVQQGLPKIDWDLRERMANSSPQLLSNSDRVPSAYGLVLHGADLHSHSDVESLSPYSRGLLSNASAQTRGEQYHTSESKHFASATNKIRNGGDSASLSDSASEGDYVEDYIDDDADDLAKRRLNVIIPSPDIYANFVPGEEANVVPRKHTDSSPDYSRAQVHDYSESAVADDNESMTTDYSLTTAATHYSAVTADYSSSSSPYLGSMESSLSPLSPSPSIHKLVRAHSVDYCHPPSYSPPSQPDPRIQQHDPEQSSTRVGLGSFDILADNKSKNVGGHMRGLLDKSKAGGGVFIPLNNASRTHDKRKIGANNSKQEAWSQNHNPQYATPSCVETEYDNVENGVNVMETVFEPSPVDSNKSPLSPSHKRYRSKQL